jgi:hypothetical protein
MLSNKSLGTETKGDVKREEYSKGCSISEPDGNDEAGKERKDS